jgi:hypothetical protein
MNRTEVTTKARRIEIAALYMERSLDLERMPRDRG